MRYGRLLSLLVVVLLALPTGAELSLALCGGPSQCPMMQAMKAASAAPTCADASREMAGELPDCCRAEAPADEAPPLPAVTVPGPDVDLGEAPVVLTDALLVTSEPSSASGVLRAVPIRGAPLRTLLQTFLL